MRAESPAIITVCPGRTARSVPIPASSDSVTMYEPAAPDTTAEKKLPVSAPRKPPSDAAPIQEYSPCAMLQLNLVSVPSIVASSS